MKKLFHISLIFFLTASLLSAVSSDRKYSEEEARKLDGFMKRMMKKRNRSVYMKKKAFTESELNSYLNLIYLKKYVPEIKTISIALEKKNRVEGEISLLFKGEKYKALPSFLKEFDVEFSGTLECSNYRVRFIFDDLKVNGATFSPDLLDQAFSATQSSNKVKKSMYDWFAMVPGIKSVKIDKGSLTVFY